LTTGAAGQIVHRLVNRDWLGMKPTMPTSTKIKTWPSRRHGGLASSIAALALAFGAIGAAHAQAANAYPSMAPAEQYRMSQADEVVLARSAAPAAIADKAEVMTLGAHGYETAAKGENGFVCMVQRAWAGGFDDADFWNPKPRSPICFNAAAVRSVLPEYLERTQWVLAGVPKAELIARTKAEIANRKIPTPDVGAMSYMMSKDGMLNDGAGHWHPHLMFYLPKVAPAVWGAGVSGAPVLADDSGLEPVTVFFIPVPKWSDGTMAMAGM
jgi:hypothetical protein